MDAPERAQTRIIVERLAELAQIDLNEKIDAYFAEQSAMKMLRSGNTINQVVRIIEDRLSQLISEAVDQVALVAMDTEAFAMLSEMLAQSVSPLDAVMRRTIQLAGADKSASATNAAIDLLSNARRRLTDQLNVHSFTFTKPSPSKVAGIAARPSQTPLKRQSKGGRPPAEFWDDMWAAIAAQLYDGTLKPTKQAHIEAAMSDWIIGNDHEAGTTTIRGRARRLWDAINTGND